MYVKKLLEMLQISSSEAEEVEKLVEKILKGLQLV